MVGTFDIQLSDVDDASRFVLRNDFSILNHFIYLRVCWAADVADIYLKLIPLCSRFCSLRLKGSFSRS